MTKPDSNRAAQQRLRDRRAALGLQRVELWVPAAAVERLRRYAARLTRDNSQAHGAEKDRPATCRGER